MKTKKLHSGGEACFVRLNLGGWASSLSLLSSFCFHGSCCVDDSCSWVFPLSCCFVFVLFRFVSTAPLKVGSCTYFLCCLYKLGRFSWLRRHLNTNSVPCSIPVSSSSVVIVVDVFVSAAPLYVARYLCLCFDLGLP